MITNEQKTYKGKLDAIGMGVSIACAIHCVLLPVFFTTLPLLGIEIMGNIVLETITVVLSAIIGSWALIRGFRAYHYKIIPVLIFIVSMMILIVANFNKGASEIILKFLAITGIITAHLLNWYYSRNCRNHVHR
jgi:hypothetical protein